MSLEVDQIPQINLGGGNQSNWNAVHNPLIFKFRRIDLVIDHVYIGAGTESQADIFPDDDSDPLFLAIASGDKIYISNTVVTGLFSVILADSAKFRVALAPGYTAGTYADGFFNLMTGVKNYRLEMQIGLVVDDEIVPFITTEWVPDALGHIEVDVSAYLKSKLPLVNDFDYESINQKDTNLSNLFSVNIRQVWTGYEGEEFSSLGDYYITNSARQIGDRYGANLAEFALFSSLSTAKFISGFVQPRYWLGMPFDIQFINSISSALTRKTIAKDVNGSGAIQIGADLQPDHFPYINRMILSDVVDPSAAFIDVFIALDGSPLTETKRVKLETPCTNPVYLCWKSKNGGWDYWMFQWNQRHKRNTGDLVAFEQYITDFAAATSRIETSSKTSVPSMVLGASLVPNADKYYNEQYPGLTGLLDSPKVLMLKNPDTWTEDGPVWITVTPKTGSFNVIETRAKSSDLELEIVLPYIQIETQ